MRNINPERLVEDLDCEQELGDYRAVIMRDSNSGKKYYVKSNHKILENIDRPQYTYLFELVGARFYKYFCQKAIIPETMLLSRTTGEINLASEWIEFFSFFENVPYINGDRVVAVIHEQEQIIETDFSEMLIAKLIDDYDFAGVGANIGYVREEDQETGTIIYRLVKIDPGAAFSSIGGDETRQTLFSIMGIITLVSKKIHKLYIDPEIADFHTYIPFSMINFSKELPSG